MNVSRLRLVTFDVTNTLLKFRSHIGQQYGEIGAMYGVLCDQDALAVNFKSHWYKMNKEHPNFGLNSGLGWENWWKQIVMGAFRDSKFNIDDKKLESVASHLVEAYKTSLCWQQTYGSLGLLSYLRHRGVPLGIISNFDPRLHSLLVNTKIRHYFKFVLTSYDAGVQKPSREIFDQALIASKISDIKPGDCLHVGDTLHLDYEGALNCGWNSYIIKDKQEASKEKYASIDTSHIFSNLYDLHKFMIDNWNSDSCAQRS